MLTRDLLWNDGWQFRLAENDALDISTADSGQWTEVEVPHDWLIGDTRNLYASGDGWYRKDFDFAAEDAQSCVYLAFDGVYMDSTVYVNGRAVGDWKYGYSSFYFDITGFLTVGKNRVHVQVRYRSPNSRWYSGAGIFRNVFLRLREKEHIAIDGVYISPRLEDGQWKVYVDTETKGEGRLTHLILDKDGRTVAQGEGSSCCITVDSPMLWDIYKGNLYTLRTAFAKNGKTLDVQNNIFGFRRVEFTPEGFFINGRKEKLHGVCMHHDLGALGSAMNEAALKRQLEILKGFGVNAIRSSHNMPARELVKLCSEMGLLMDTESFDMWENPKTAHDYGNWFKDWYKKDIAAWVRRDRNAPCVIMWSVGNEIGDTNSPRGLEVVKQLKEAVLEHDPKGNAVPTLASNFLAWEPAQKVSDVLKQGGYNYAEQFYQKHHEMYPDWFIYGSETSSAVRSRGVYHLPASAAILTHDDLQCSDMGNSCVGWGKPMEKAWIMDRDCDFCGGEFVWTGFDYIGEPTPYSTKNSYFGIVDTAGLFKESYYFYKSVWTDGKKSPFVHILPAWDFNEGQEVEVRTYSNVEDVELFLNGKSLGKQHIDLAHGDVLHGSWKVNYTEGELIARAYDRNGREAAFDRRASFGEAAEICITPEKRSMLANGRDLIFLRISVLDENGEPVANARNRVKVEVSGAGRLMGLDSGDSTDYDSYRGNSKRLFSGMLTAIIGATFESGDVNISVSSKGLPTSRLVLSSVECDIPEGTAKPCPQFPVYVQENSDKISVRKIELTADRIKLDGDNPSACVTAKILPENADYRDITWKCVVESGVVSPVAQVKGEGGKATVTAKGDGSFILRAMVNNGFDHPEVISDLYFTAEGLGQALTNPYEFVSASLWSFSNVVPSIVERGAVSGINSRTVIGFDNVDAGSFGSDALRLYMGVCGSELEVEMWLGDPDNGETQPRLIDTLHFPENNGWDRFLPVEFTLPERVRGVVSISFVINRNCIFGGFELIRQNRAAAAIHAGEYDEIYGDDFEIVDNRIEKIGNNVVIGFNGLDFGEGAAKVTVCGRTPNEENPIQIRYTPEGGEQITQLVKFANSSEYCEQCFDIERIAGKVSNMSFVFMPGSSFDFDWFRFE